MELKFHKDMCDGAFRPGRFYREKLLNRRVIVNFPSDDPNFVIIKCIKLDKKVNAYNLTVNTSKSKANNRGIVVTYFRLSREAFDCLVKVGITQWRENE